MSIPGHSIEAVNEIKSSLWAAAGGKGAKIRPKMILAGTTPSVEELINVIKEGLPEARLQRPPAAALHLGMATGNATAPCVCRSVPRYFPALRRVCAV